MITSLQLSSGDAPGTFRLDQNYPNPFNPATTIGYTLPSRSHASLEIFNALGQHVATLANEIQEQGSHNVRFDGSGLASGVYYYRLRVENWVTTRMLALLR